MLPPPKSLAHQLRDVADEALAYQLVYILANRGNGRFGRGARPEDLRALAEPGTQAVPPPLRAWVLDVVDQCTIELNRAYGAKSTLPEGYCARQLARLEEPC
jgi:hypothetical protein